MAGSAAARAFRTVGGPRLPSSAVRGSNGVHAPEHPSAREGDTGLDPHSAWASDSHSAVECAGASPRKRRRPPDIRRRRPRGSRFKAVTPKAATTSSGRFASTLPSKPREEVRLPGPSAPDCATPNEIKSLDRGPLRMLPVVDGAPALGPHREHQAALVVAALDVAIPERGAEVAVCHRAEILFATRWPHGGDRSLDAHIAVERRRLALRAQRESAGCAQRAALLRILSGEHPDADGGVVVVPDRHR